MEDKILKEKVKEHITYCVSDHDRKTLCGYFTNHPSVIFQGEDLAELEEKGIALLKFWNEACSEMLANGIEFREVSPREYSKEYYDKEGLKKEIEKLKAQNNWVDCKDRLPNPDDIILALTIEGVKFCKFNARYQQFERHTENSGNDRIINFHYNNVTHWMPLPASPITYKQ